MPEGAIPTGLWPWSVAPARRAAVGATLLQRFGAREVIHVVEGGVPFWQRHGWPVDSPGTPET